MSKEKLYIVSLSGGKDSTAMLLRLIEEKRPIDRILFCDTGLEFPQMYDHLNKLEQYIGRKITRLKAEYSFEYYFLEYMPKRKNPGLRQYTGNSWAGPNNRWCTGRLKINVVNKYLKELKKNYDVVEYIGIAADEPKRVKHACYPLVEWGMTERTALIIVMRTALIGAGCTRYFTACHVGVAPYSLCPNCASCMSVSLNCGSNCVNGTMTHGRNSVRSTRYESWR